MCLLVHLYTSILYRNNKEKKIKFNVKESKEEKEKRMKESKSRKNITPRMLQR